MSDLTTHHIPHPEEQPANVTRLIPSMRRMAPQQWRPYLEGFHGVAQPINLHSSITPYPAWDHLPEFHRLVDEFTSRALSAGSGHDVEKLLHSHHQEKKQPDFSRLVKEVRREQLTQHDALVLGYQQRGPSPDKPFHLPCYSYGISGSWIAGLMENLRLSDQLFDQCRQRFTTWRDSHFERCLFDSSTLHHCVFDGGSWQSVALQHSMLKESLFSGMTITHLNIEDSQLRDNHFVDCHFQACDFSKARFTGPTEFNNCRFDKMDLGFLANPNIRLDAFCRIGADCTMPLSVRRRLQEQHISIGTPSASVSDAQHLDRLIERGPNVTRLFGNHP